MWIGFWAAAFPDSDFVLNLVDPLTYLTAHRGITHSVVMLPLWALGLSLVLAWVLRRRYSWRAFMGVVTLGIGIHILGDVITAFGTMVFAPLSDYRAAWPTTFIIDPYFTLILVAGLIGARIYQRTRAAAVTALALLVAYVGAQGLLHQRATGIGAAYAVQAQIPAVRVEAIPQPFSPFHWLVTVVEPQGYHLGYVSLVRDAPPLPAATDAPWYEQMHRIYQPAAALQWHYVARFGAAAETHLAETVWYSQTLERFRHFALWPALYRVDNGADQVCVWFNDLRFALAGRGMPFRYGACADGARVTASSVWRVYRLITDDFGKELPDPI
jgi:inner membrane protein